MIEIKYNNESIKVKYKGIPIDVVSELAACVVNVLENVQKQSDVSPGLAKAFCVGLCKTYGINCIEPDIVSQAMDIMRGDKP